MAGVPNKFIIASMCFYIHDLQGNGRTKKIRLGFLFKLVDLSASLRSGGKDCRKPSSQGYMIYLSV